MSKFVLNQVTQANGDNEVHNATDGCRYMPSLLNQIDLGYHESCHQAVADAKRKYPNYRRINGCAFCCPACHTT